MLTLTKFKKMNEKYVGGKKVASSGMKAMQKKKKPRPWPKRALKTINCQSIDKKKHRWGVSCNSHVDWGNSRWAKGGTPRGETCRKKSNPNRRMLQKEEKCVAKKNPTGKGLFPQARKKINKPDVLRRGKNIKQQKNKNFTLLDGLPKLKRFNELPHGNGKSLRGVWEKKQAMGDPTTGVGGRAGNSPPVGYSKGEGGGGKL